MTQMQPNARRAAGRRLRVKITRPRTRIMDLAVRPGGVVREVAVAAANERISTLRGPSVTAIEATITELEAVAARLKDKPDLSVASLEIVRPADRIITLARTYGFDRLALAAESLCNLIADLTQTNVEYAEPICVHTRAMRLMSPFGEGLAEAEQEAVLSELSKIRAHLQKESA